LAAFQIYKLFGPPAESLSSSLLFFICFTAKWKLLLDLKINGKEVTLKLSQ